MPEFLSQDPFPQGKDDTKYRLLTKEYVSVSRFNGKEILVVDPEGLAFLAHQALRDVSFLLRPAHLAKVAAILSDPEAAPNDRGVAVAMLRNAEVSAHFVLPFCQDTGTATILGKKGQQVFTGAPDEEYLSRGVYKTYTEENLRYSQTIPLTMYEEKNSGTNLPAQIDLYATEGQEYKFLFVAKGGGSGKKPYLFQETKALLNPASLEKFLVEKMKTLGTAACPPYHLAFAVGGTSAEACLKTVKLASTGYLDHLPTKGNDGGQAFRDLEMEERILKAAHRSGYGAQFGGKYFALDVRVARLPRHGASCPVGMGVSCSADRNIKARIDKEGIWLEEMERNPGRLIPEKYRERLDRGEGMPQYLKEHPVYYAGPAKTPKGMPSGSFGPTTAGRMDSYVDLFPSHGGSLIMIAKGNRSQQVTDACKKHGGFYLGSIGGPAALLAQENIRNVEEVEYPQM